MKKIAKWFLVLLLALSLFACKKTEDPKEEIPADLKTAKDYLTQMYKNDATATANDYTRVAQLTLAGVTYAIEWKVTVTQGQATDVVLETAEDGKTITVNVNEKSDAEITYTITATIKNADNKSVELSWDHTVPAFKELTYAQYIAAVADDTVVVKGVVTAICSKTNGNSANCLYMQDADGAYYVYSMNDDPVTQGIKVGMTVRVSGAKDIYSGTHEIKNATAEILDTTIKTVEPVDYTEAFKNAEKLTDAAITDKQSILVTIKGVELTTVNTSNGYYQFKLGSLESYIRISSSVCPLSKDDQATMKANHKQGYKADVTGIVSLYSGAFYLTPVTVDAIANLQLPELSDADAVAFEKEALTFDEKIIEACEKTLATAGAAYSKVTITWASDSAQAVVSEDGTKVAFTLADAEAEVKLTATLKAGEVTETKEFTVKVASAAKNWITAAQAIEECAKLDAASKETSADWYYIVGEIIDEPTADYCNFNFSDGTTQIKIYGLYTADGTQRYGSKRDIAELPVKQGDTVYLFAKLQNYNGTLEIVSARLQEAPVPGSSATCPMTAAQAIAECAKLDAATKETSADYYWVKATIIDAPTTDYCNFNFSDGTTNIKVYGLYTADGTQRYGSKREIAELPVEEGYTVLLYTKLQNYNGTLECVSAQLKEATAPATPVEYTVTVAENADATVTLSATSGVKGTEITFTVAAAEGKEVTAVKVNDSKVEATDGTYKFTLTANTTVTVETKEAGAAEPTPEHAGTAEDPYTVADIILVSKDLEKSAWLEGVVYVKGIIKSATQKGSYLQNIYLVDAADSTDSFLVYTANLTDAVSCAFVGDTVVIKGHVTNYNGTKEMSTYTNSDNVKEYNEFAAKPAVAKAALTVTAENATVTGVDATADNGSTVKFTVVAAEGYKVSEVTVNGKAVEAAEDGSYSFVVGGDSIVLVTVIAADQKEPLKATLAYTDTTTTANMTADTDAATTLGLDANKFEVKAVLGTEEGASTTYPGLNKAQEIRMYTFNQIVVTAKEGVTISSITVDVQASYSSNLEVVVNGTAVAAVDGVYTINATSFAIRNNNAGTAKQQVRLNSVTITYEDANAGEVTPEPTYVAFIGEQGYETVAAAVEAATAGQRVVLVAGTYAEDITLKDGVSLIGATPELTLKHSDEFVADETKNTILTGVVTVKGENAVVLQGLVFAKQLVVAGQKDLTVKNCVFTGVIDAGYGQLLVSAKSDNMIIDSCYTNSKSARFVYFQASSTNFTYTNCSTLDAATVAIYDVVRFGVGNDTLIDGTITIANNYFGKSNQAGVYCRFNNASTALADFTATYIYTNNYFYQSPAAIWHRGVGLQNAVNYTVTGNTFVECGSMPLDWDVVALTNYVGAEGKAASTITVNYNAFVNSFTEAATAVDYVVKVRNAQTEGVDCSKNYFSEIVNGNKQLNATGVDTAPTMAATTYTQEAQEAYAVSVNEAGEMSVYGVNVLPLVKVAVWATGTNDAVWVTDEELENTKNAIVSFLADNGYLEGTYKLEFEKIVTEGNTVAQYGTATNAGTYDFIIGCGANVTTKGLVQVAEKQAVPTTIFAANRYVARISESAIAKLMYKYYTLQVEGASTAA